MGAMTLSGEARSLTAVSERPSCECHGVPQRWQKDARHTCGGYWQCAVRQREWESAYRRRRGIAPLRSEQYLEKVRTEEPAYRTMHHRARRELRDEPCGHCGTQINVEAALRHDGSPSARRLSSRGLAYSTRVEDYLALCRPCHTTYNCVSERVTKWHRSKK